jgi:hypothetical protein
LLLTEEQEEYLVFDVPVDNVLDYLGQRIDDGGVGSAGGRRLVRYESVAQHGEVIYVEGYG